MVAPLHVSVPDAPPLSATLLDDLRARLLAGLHAKAAEHAEHDARAAALTGAPDADSRLERALAELGARRAQQAMGEIERALARVDLGTYGSCEACGGSVARERLDAIPYTRHCVSCSAGERESSP